MVFLNSESVMAPLLSLIGGQFGLNDEAPVISLSFSIVELWSAGHEAALAAVTSAHRSVSSKVTLACVAACERP